MKENESQMIVRIHVNVIEAAKIVGISERGMSRWALLKWVPSCKINGAYIFAKPILNRVVEARKRYGRNWKKKVKFTDVELSLIEPKLAGLKPEEHQALHSLSLAKRLGGIAKILSNQGDRKNAAEVALIACEVM